MNEDILRALIQISEELRRLAVATEDQARSIRELLNMAKEADKE